MKLDEIIAIYERNLASSEVLAVGDFSLAPPDSLSPPEFVDALIAEAAEHDVRAFHPFMRNLVGGRYSAPQLREWVRQCYPSVIADIRRHALIAGVARECDLLRSLLSYVGLEADADPVGGNFFSLPQLWVKFGIALDLTREDIIRATPCAELLAWEQAATDRVSRDTVPISLFVNAVLDSAIASHLGTQLQAHLGYARDCFDYFRAISGNRWGDDVGRPILESWCVTRAGQQEVWSRYAHERKYAGTQERLSITQAVVEAISGQ